MNDFSQDDLDIIARDPLNLDHLHDLLHDAEKSYSSHLLSCDGAVDNPDGGVCQTAISTLLGTLQIKRAAYSLRLKVNNRTAAAEIAFLFERIQDGHFCYEDYRTLSRLVRRRAPDVDIWKAVIDVVDFIRVTLPSKLSHRISYSSAYQERSEQTCLEKNIFEEIKRCTYRDVDGFFEKYFEGKGWTDRALDIYEAMKGRHANGAWIDFPEAGILDWWFQFQEEFLSDEQRCYYSTTKPSDLVGAKPQRQIDLLLKQKSKQLPNAAHEWRHVDVVGQIKASSNDRNGILLQIGRYVREVFSCQPTRLFVHAFIICGCDMEVWVFDRSGCYSPGSFDIHKEPKRFIQVIAGYAMMNEKELGLDTYIERNGDSHFIHLEQDGSEDRKKLWLQPDAFTLRQAIVSRGTSCYLTKTSETGEDWDCVTKFSWMSDKQEPEIDLLKLVLSRGVEGVATLIGHHRITSTQELRSGLKFRKSRYSSAGSRPESEFRGLGDGSRKRKLVEVDGKPSESLRSGNNVEEVPEADFVFDSSESYDNRIFRCLVISPAGRAIYKFENKLELLGALRDAIKAHRSLYIDGNILHRDISENNIIITDPPTTGFMGMLIDLDLAMEVGSRCSSAHCRTGTLQFMAYEVLLLDVEHTYRHDLESFFYVLIWQCARRSWGDNWPIHSRLMKWCNSDYEDMANAKYASINMSHAFRLILGEFLPDFGCLKPLFWELRRILFPVREGAIFTGTPEDPETLYKPIIQAFDSAIESVQAEDE